MARPAGEQDAINCIFTGGWREVPIGIYLGIGATLWGYVWSFRSTVRPHVVTAAKQQIPLTPVGAQEAEAIAKLGPSPRTLWERLTSSR